MCSSDLGQPVHDAKHHHLFDPICVARLKRILDATDAKIVLSSAWRMFGKEEFRRVWLERNMPSEIIDFTPKTPSGQRGREIGIWLNDHKDEVESFVIIDDDVFDMDVNHFDFVVQTTWDNGLTDGNVEHAIRVLNTK